MPKQTPRAGMTTPKTKSPAHRGMRLWLNFRARGSPGLAGVWSTAAAPLAGREQGLRPLTNLLTPVKHTEPLAFR